MMSTMIEAARSGNIHEVCRSFDQEEADNALIIAAERGHHIIVEVLVVHYGVFASTEALLSASSNNHETIVSFLMHMCDIKSCSLALFLASLRGHVNVMFALMSLEGIRVPEVLSQALVCASARGNAGSVCIIMASWPMHQRVPYDAFAAAIREACIGNHTFVMDQLMGWRRRPWPTRG